MICDGNGVPLVVTVTGGNHNDVTQLLPLVDALPAIPGRRGRPQRRFPVLVANRGYDHDIYRDQLRDRRTVGDGLGNVTMESFWSSLQIEVLNRRRWKTQVELANAIFEYIEIFHNRRRRHSALSYTNT